MKTKSNQVQIYLQKLAANAIPSNAVKLDVVFTNTEFSVPINFGRAVSGDAKCSKLWRHPFTKRVAIRTPRIPAQNFNSAKPQEEQAK